MDWYYAEGDEQHGPVSEEEFSRLIDGGVIAPDTLIWCAAMTDWRTFKEVRAMGSLLPSADTDPVPLHRAADDGDKTEPLAVACLVLAIVSWGCGFMVGIAAVVCGHIALYRINAAGGRLAGRPLAMGGLVIGYFSLLVHAASTLFFILSFANNG
jgi:hypothetical protein